MRPTARVRTHARVHSKALPASKYRINQNIREARNKRATYTPHPAPPPPCARSFHPLCSASAVNAPIHPHLRGRRLPRSCAIHAAAAARIPRQRPWSAATPGRAAPPTPAAAAATPSYGGRGRRRRRRRRRRRAFRRDPGGVERDVEKRGGLGGGLLTDPVVFHLSYRQRVRGGLLPCPVGSAGGSSRSCCAQALAPASR